MRLVGDGHGVIWSPEIVELDNHDAWIHGGDTVPDPVVHAVDVDREQIDVARKSIVLE